MCLVFSQGFLDGLPSCADSVHARNGCFNSLATWLSFRHGDCHEQKIVVATVFGYWLRVVGGDWNIGLIWDNDG